MINRIGDSLFKRLRIIRPNASCIIPIAFRTEHLRGNVTHAFIREGILNKSIARYPSNRRENRFKSTIPDVLANEGRFVKCPA